jgi:hypothetical protein
LWYFSTLNRRCCQRATAAAGSARISGLTHSLTHFYRYDAANQRPRRWSKLLAGEGEKVDAREVEPLYFLDPTGKTKVMRAPNAAFYPIFSVFRAHLREVDGRYEDKKAPTIWPAAQFEEACQRLAMKIGKAVKDKDHLDAVERDQGVWATCFETLNSFPFEFRHKSRD